jgi:LPS-assembly protein
VYLREEVNLYPHYLRSFQADSRFGNPDLRYFSFGIFYQNGLTGQLDYTTGVGFWPSTKWRIDYNIRYTTLNNFGSVRVNYQELRLYRDLHCWEFRLAYRRRINVEEINFMLNLKTSALANPLRRQEEFYPWR